MSVFWDYAKELVGSFCSVERCGMALHVCHVKQATLTDDSPIKMGMRSAWL